MARPKLHLRDLFWLVLVAGLVLGWWLERKARQTFQKAAGESDARLTKLNDALKHEGFWVFWDDDSQSYEVMALPGSPHFDAP